MDKIEYLNKLRAEAAEREIAENTDKSYDNFMYGLQIIAGFAIIIIFSLVISYWFWIGFVLEFFIKQHIYGAIPVCSLLVVGTSALIGYLSAYFAGAKIKLKPFQDLFK